VPKFLSLTELGRLYGVSRNKIGQWLVDLGLRTKDKKPSARAFNEGFVDQRGSTQPGTYFWVWHDEKTPQLLDEAGYMRTDQKQVAGSPMP
jgi:hypothetical protein